MNRLYFRAGSRTTLSLKMTISSLAQSQKHLFGRVGVVIIGVVIGVVGLGVVIGVVTGVVVIMSLFNRKFIYFIRIVQNMFQTMILTPVLGVVA